MADYDVFLAGCPALTWEEQPWASRQSRDTVPRALAARQAGPYRAAIVPEIADLQPQLSGGVLALAEDASNAITRFDAEVGAELAPFASVLLRSEAASSSLIENLTSLHRASSARGSTSSSVRMGRADERPTLPTYRVTWRPISGTRHLLADIEAHELATDLDGARITLWRYVLIVDSPRRIAVLRVMTCEAAVELCCSANRDHRSNLGDDKLFGVRSYRSSSRD